MKSVSQSLLSSMMVTEAKCSRKLGWPTSSVSRRVNGCFRCSFPVLRCTEALRPIYAMGSGAHDLEWSLRVRRSPNSDGIVALRRVTPRKERTLDQRRWIT